MLNYKKLYFKLFNDITDAIEILQSPDTDLQKIQADTTDKLINAQLEAEELYLDLCEEAYPNGEDLESNNLDNEEYDPDNF